MTRSRKARRTVVDAAIAVVAILAGVGLAFLGSAVYERRSDDRPIALPADDFVLDLTVPAPGPGAATSRDAVSTFLDAEQNHDNLAAFALLSADDRARYPSSTIWAARRPSALGQVTRWEWSNEGELATYVELEPSLSNTTGWTPAAATIEWVAVDEDGWRISLDDSSISPVLPPVSEAVAATVSWLEGNCRSEEAAERTQLASDPVTVRWLCENGGSSLVGTPEPVSGRLAAELAVRYGPGASTWAVSVAVGENALVLAAIGDEWVVVDAVGSS